MTARPRQAGRITVQRGTPATPPRGTRPRNRRQLIITAAADLFASDGYAQVSMADIAAAVAVRPSALYRHVHGKNDLLYQVIDGTLSAMQAAVHGLASARELAVTALNHRRLGVLWQRESRHLPPAARERLRTRLTGIAAQVAAFIARCRPDLHATESDLLAWSCLEAATSISFQRIILPRPEYTDLLAGIIDRIIGTDLHSPSAVATAPPPDTDLDRRDELLTAAARLFAERGYHSVGIDDVGTAVGIAGPSIYHHFTTKLDLIVAIMNRGADQLVHATAHTLADARDDTEALDALLRAYTSFLPDPQPRDGRAHHRDPAPARTTPNRTPPDPAPLPRPVAAHPCPAPPRAAARAHPGPPAGRAHRHQRHRPHAPAAHQATRRRGRHRHRPRHPRPRAPPRPDGGHSRRSRA